jgi:phage-related tail fiber protein
MTLTRVTENILDIDSIAPVLAPAVAGIITSATVNTPPGTIVFHCGSTAPSGYLKANGAAISRSTYSSLFSAIGVTFGFGDGSTTFNLPDLRGEFIRSWDDGRGIDSGRTFGTFQDGFLPSHTHTMAHTHTIPNHAHQLPIGWDSGSTYGWSDGAGNPVHGSGVVNPVARIIHTNNAFGTGAARIAFTESGGGGGTSSGASNETTSAPSVSNSSTARPRNIALLACIKF